MPGAGLVFDRRQRDALRAEVAEILEDLGAIVMAMRDARWEGARKMREQFVGLMRLLDDLGWSPRTTASSSR